MITRMKTLPRIGLIVTSLLLLATLALPAIAEAATNIPIVTINSTGSTDTTAGEVYSGLKIVALLTILVFIPSIVMCATSFTRIAIVLAMTRQALGTAQTPPNQVIIGISLFLTIAIMGPVFNDIYSNSLLPYSEDQISHTEAMQKAFAPLRTFMLRHTREQDLSLFMEMQKIEPPKSPDDLGATVVIPAFLLSELNTAYQIAFLIYMPFLILG